jgi:cytoskeletal protein CcmA (bactofilin family)
MFGKKQQEPSSSIEVTKLSSLIADNVEIVGDIHFSGGLRVDGRIRGSVRSAEGEKSLLVVSQTGYVEGDVEVHDAVVNGSLSGDLHVDHFLELQPKARVRGNIRYRQLKIECGAAVEGQLSPVERDVTEEQSHGKGSSHLHTGRPALDAPKTIPSDADKTGAGTD